MSHIHPKRTYQLKLSLCGLSVSGFTVLPVASLLSVKRASLSSQLPRNRLGSSNTGQFSTTLLCRLHFSVLHHFKIEVVLTADVKDSHYNFVVLFLGLAAEDEDVVHVDGHYSLIDEFLEDVIHHCLECGGTVCEAEEHDQRF